MLLRRTRRLLIAAGAGSSLCWSALASAWSPARQAEVIAQCPADTDGIDTDGDGIVDNDVVCMHLAAGDGFVNMADGEAAVHVRLQRRHWHPAAM